MTKVGTSVLPENSPQSQGPAKARVDLVLQKPSFSVRLEVNFFSSMGTGKLLRKVNCQDLLGIEQTLYRDNTSGSCMLCYMSFMLGKTVA